MKTITEKKQDATLNKVFRYEEGIMTRKEWLRLKHSQGWVVEQKEIRNYIAEDKLSDWLFKHSYMNSGNPNWPETKIWLAENERLKNGIYKTEYHISDKKTNSFYDITKTEFDYFNTFLLTL